jgi:starch synthase
VFDEMSADGLLAAASRALAAYGDKPVWQKIQHNGMSRDFSWKKSAGIYEGIYHSLIK